jgi:hypothetical protein
LKPSWAQSPPVWANFTEVPVLPKLAGGIDAPKGATSAPGSFFAADTYRCLHFHFWR